MLCEESGFSMKQLLQAGGPIKLQHGSVCVFACLLRVVKHLAGLVQHIAMWPQRCSDWIVVVVDFGFDFCEDFSTKCQGSCVHVFLSFSPTSLYIVDMIEEFFLVRSLTHHHFSLSWKMLF